MVPYASAQSAQNTNAELSPGAVEVVTYLDIGSAPTNPGDRHAGAGLGKRLLLVSQTLGRHVPLAAHRV